MAKKPFHEVMVERISELVDVLLKITPSNASFLSLCHYIHEDVQLIECSDIPEGQRKEMRRQLMECADRLWEDDYYPRTAKLIEDAAMSIEEDGMPEITGGCLTGDCYHDEHKMKFVSELNDKCR